jgi:poly(3-hydroxybutyrate) depolymerase
MPAPPVERTAGFGAVSRLFSACLAACGLLLSGCTTMSSPGPPGELVSRTPLAAGAEWIVVSGGGRDIRSLVLLPDGYAPGRDYPLLVAVHNFAGNAQGFAGLIHAERLRARGIILLLPQAAGRVPNWQGPGLTLLGRAYDGDGRRVDDVSGMAAVLRVATGLYRVDEVNVTGFSQGATLALALTRRLDAERPGAVRRLFMVAGSARRPVDASLALAGTDLVAYEPGRNGPQAFANWLTDEPAERVFLPRILQAKGCMAPSVLNDGIERRTYGCADGHTVIHLFEAKGEHAWPGQDAKDDSWVTGRGSTSRIDFTNLIAHTIAPVAGDASER